MQFAKRFILEYLKFWAKQKLKQNPKAILIGVTGSAGKTSARLALVQILKTHGVVKHSIHANSESGIPLNILGLSMHTYSLFDWLRVLLLAPIRLLSRENFDYYVAEMGIDSPFPPKNMSYLLSILRPHVAIVLGATPTHTANFDPLVKDISPARRQAKLVALIAKEKMQLAHSILPSGTAIINLDSKALHPYLKGIRARTLTFGTSSHASLHITKVNLSRSGFNFRFTYQGNSYNFSHPDILGAEYAHTFAAALAAASSLGIPISSGLESLRAFRAPAGRLRLFAGINHSHVLDSSYNASPATMHSALELLGTLGGRAHKIAVLGDMNELGVESKLAHRELAMQAMRTANEVILFGPHTLAHSLPLFASHHFPARHFTKMKELIAYLRPRVSRESWILVKGSQNQIMLERAVAALLADRSAVSQLARRGKYWDNIRSKTP